MYHNRRSLGNHSVLINMFVITDNILPKVTEKRSELKLNHAVKEPWKHLSVMCGICYDSNVRFSENISELLTA